MLKLECLTEGSLFFYDLSCYPPVENTASGFLTALKSPDPGWRFQDNCRLRAVSLFLENVRSCASVTARMTIRGAMPQTRSSTLGFEALPIAPHALNHARMITCFVFFTAGLRGKGALLAV